MITIKATMIFKAKCFLFKSKRRWISKGLALYVIHFIGWREYFWLLGERRNNVLP